MPPVGLFSFPLLSKSPLPACEYIIDTLIARSHGPPSNFEGCYQCSTCPSTTARDADSRAPGDACIGYKFATAASLVVPACLQWIERAELQCADVLGREGGDRAGPLCREELREGGAWEGDAGGSIQGRPFLGFFGRGGGGDGDRRRIRPGNSGQRGRQDRVDCGGSEIHRIASTGEVKHLLKRWYAPVGEGGLRGCERGKRKRNGGESDGVGVWGDVNLRACPSARNMRLEGKAPSF
ncbi:hypothetical protein Naga_100331g7 [Nannochloropsis gaditana]|uniref:Uncharacterized protein n=1 Tax=Nannochloropsis gaditana TaxID=72520 RepID=W7TKJ4_9STRA|nr:hypothetical protein Naga_100331g7 [Nannochloropsis gaditana]